MKISLTYKKLLAFALAILLLMAAITVHAEGGDEPQNLAKPSFITSDGGLYINARAGSDSTQAWQKWQSYSGMNASSSSKYFFLPSIADDSKTDIYNNYSQDVTIGDVTVKAGETCQINYVDGKAISVTQGKNRYSLIIRKSDAEASVYVNDTNTSFVDANGQTVNTDLYSFLIQNKENSVKGSSVAVVGQNGITETTLKKIKGRGNTNWTQTDKKPFNLTFNDTITIGHTTNKKFSFVSNAKDSTLIRNSVMYDMAHDVGLPYSSNTSFVDFYVNGDYRGCYIACDKVDMGKSSVVALKDTSDTANSGFNFLVEVDVWNYKNDVYFETSRGYHVVLKTPDLDGYDETNADMKAKYDYIKNTYQNFENVLYTGTMSELEGICDLDSLALMYLLQDLGKNCDGGYTSTYFTYNADEGKFYAAPIWDCDSELGAVDCVRDGCSTSTCNVTGWTTRTATYNRTVNPYGKAFTTKGKTADGKTFEDIVKEKWNSKILPAIDVLAGRLQSNGRLRSFDEYASSIAKASYNNYIMWDFMWYCAAYRGTGLNKSYSRDYSGELSYLKDWTNARVQWISSQYSSLSPSEPETAPDNPTYSDYYLTGQGFGGWGATAYKLTPNNDGSYYIDVTLEKGSHYYFKIFDGGTNYYTANFDDPETATYVSPSQGANRNAEATPTEDQKVRITLRNGAFYITTQPTEEPNPTEPTQPVNPDSKVTVYFVNLKNWNKVNFYCWYGSGQRAVTKSDWPGEPAQFVGYSDGEEIYKAVIDAEYQNIIFNDGQSTGEQTADIALSSGKTYSPTGDGALSINLTRVFDVTSTDYKLAPVTGDVDINGEININDATLIQLALIGKATLTDIQNVAANTDKGSKVNIRDVTMIQLYLAGRIDRL